MTDDYVYAGSQEGGPARSALPDHCAGLVLRWRRRGDSWEGLVRRTVDGHVRTEWLLAMELAPGRAVQQ